MAKAPWLCPVLRAHHCGVQGRQTPGETYTLIQVTLGRQQAPHLWQERVRPPCLLGALMPGHPHHHKCPWPAEGDIKSGLSLGCMGAGAGGGRPPEHVHSPTYLVSRVPAPQGDSGPSPPCSPVTGRESGGTATHRSRSHVHEHSSLSHTSSTAATLGLARAAHGRDWAGPGHMPPVPSDPVPRPERQGSCAPARPLTLSG